MKFGHQRIYLGRNSLIHGLFLFLFFILSQISHSNSAFADEIILNSNSWNSISMSADARVIVGSTGNNEIVISKDGGTNWNYVSENTNGGKIVKISADGKRFFIFGYNGCLINCVAISDNLGQSWQYVNSPKSDGISIYSSSVSADGKYIYLAAKNYSGPQDENSLFLWFSTDGGLTWQENLSIHPFLVSVSDNGNRIIATRSTYPGSIIYESNNGGVSYTSTNKPYSINTLGMLPNGNRAFTAHDSNLMYENSPDSWSRLDSVSSDWFAPCFAVSASSENLFIVSATSYFSKIYLSNSGGAGFNPPIGAPINGNVSCAISGNGTKILLARGSVGYGQPSLFFSLDGGNNFIPAIDPPRISLNLGTQEISNQDPIQQVDINQYDQNAGIVSYAITGDDLNGLSFDALAGSLSGTPVNSGRYEYTFTATNSRGSTSASTVINVVPKLVIPSAISLVQGKTKVRINFTGVANATDYEILITNKNDPSWVYVKNWAYSEASTSDQVEIQVPAGTLAPNTDYGISVRALSADTSVNRDSNYSEENLFTTQPLTQLEPPVLYSTENVSPARIKLNLSSSSNSIRYVVGQSAEFPSGQIGEPTITCNASRICNIEISGLAINQAYKIYIQARGDNLETSDSDFSNVLTFETLPPIQLVVDSISIVADSAYATVRVTGSPRSLEDSLGFKDAAGDNIYPIYNLISNSTDGSEKVYRVTGLFPDSNYEISIFANGDNYEYLTSAPMSKTFRTLVPRILDTPTGLSLNPNQKSAVLSWVVDPGASVYNANIYQNNVLVSNINVGNASPATILGLDPNSLYEIDLKAIGDGSSYLDSISFSERKSFTTRPLFVVQYDSNEGTGSELANSEYATEDVSITLPTPDITKPNYIFAGWSERKNLLPVFAVASSYAPTSDKILYAVWIDESEKYFQKVSLNSPTNMKIGDSDQTLTAIASSEFPIIFSSLTPNVCTIVTQKVRALAAGSCEIMATQNGKQTSSSAQIYESKSDAKTFLVSAAPVTPTPPVPPIPTREPRLIEEQKPNSSPSSTSSPEPKPLNSESSKPTPKDMPKANIPGIRKPTASEVKIDKTINLKDSVVKLRTATGQEVKDFKIKIGTGNKITVELPKGTVPGIYKIQIVTKEGKSITKTIVIKKK
jgi:Listeria-Bacteroides repeat domain (List_Bact_rpt)/Putative Ig domain